MATMAARNMVDPFERRLKESRSQSPMSCASSSASSSPLRRRSLKDEDIRPVFAPLKREDKFRNLTLSFEEIAEDDEENATTSTVPASHLNGRSPYAVNDNLRENVTNSPRRSMSLVSTLVSPKMGRRNFMPPRLSRGFSDPVPRRKWSTGSMPERSDCEGVMESLALPPIPEAATPASPFGDAQCRPFDEADDEDAGVFSSSSSQSSLNNA